MYTFYVFPGFVEAAPDSFVSKYKSVMRFGWTKNLNNLFPEHWYPILVKDLPRKADAMMVEQRFKFALMMAQTFSTQPGLASGLFVYLPGNRKKVATDLEIGDLEAWLKRVDKKIRIHPVGLNDSHRLS